MSNSEQPPTSTAQEIQAAVDQLTDADLHTRRVELTREYEVDPQAFSIEQLTELCAIMARLRAGKTGPARAPSGAKRRIAKPAVDIDNLPL